jgi:acetyl-CoA synthetase
MLTRARDYRTLYDAFRWPIPDRYNIGVDCTDKHDPAKPALIYRAANGSVTEYSFGDLSRLTNRFANLLTAHGLKRGDRVGVLAPQAPETAVAHLGAHKAGMVSVPLFTLFGEEALEYRLKTCGAAALVTDGPSLPKILAIRDRLPDLKLFLSIDGPADGAQDFHALMDKASDAFQAVDTGPDDPAILIFTSGTTGPPKGALHGHRVLLGHLPGVELPQEFFPQPGDLFWTPADWAWIGGLIDVLLPSLHHGVPVLAYRMGKFDPEEAFPGPGRLQGPQRLHAAHRAEADAPGQGPATLRPRVRSIGSGGETLGEELLAWGRDAFGLTLNEFYGQTECNLVLSNCSSLFEVRPGSMGRAVPGHRVAIVDAEFKSLKKSFPLSSTTMKAGKFSTSMRQIASMPSSSGYSTTLHLLDAVLGEARGRPADGAEIEAAMLLAGR